MPSPDTPNAYDITSSSEWESYTKYRPAYPPQVFERIYSFHKASGGKFNAAHDAGCGPGIAAAVLAEKFGHVICSDFSQAAVDTAEQAFNKAKGEGKFERTAFEFRRSGAEEMAEWIERNSLDMVTMSESLHWTDTAKTTAAVMKVLKPGGTFAVWYYGPAVHLSNFEVQAIYQETLEHWCKLRTDFSEVSARTQWVENTGYDCVAFSEEEGWAKGVMRMKWNTDGDDETWLRDKSTPWMRYEKQIGKNDVLEYIEDAKEWEYEFTDLEWFEGWFTSLFPRISGEYLTAQLKRMEEALGGNKVTTKAIWSVSMILARKKWDGE